MNGRTWSEFWSMGGYGFYVWGSYLVALLAIGGEVFLLLRRKKTLVERPNFNLNKEAGSK